MKLLPGLLLLCCIVHGAEYPALTTAALNAGGSIAAGGNVEIIGSFGGFGDVSSDAGKISTRAGFPGQIYDPSHVAITPGSATLFENAIAAFFAEIVCDDGTVLPASSLAWSLDTPLISVSAAGQVTTGPLPQNFIATLSATAGGVSGSALLTAIDTDPDDFGSYAGDGIPDSWQVNYFGIENPTGKPFGDPDGDGQNNQAEWVAGTNPTDPNSRLRLSFDPAAARPPGAASLIFSPYIPGRNYTLEWTAALKSEWSPLSRDAQSAGQPGEGLFIDPDAGAAQRFYRVTVEKP